MKKSKIDFTKGGIGSQIFLFMLPMLVGNAIQQAYSMVDGIIVGQFVSPAALASVGVAMTVTHFVVASVIGFTTGSSVVISQFFGAKDEVQLKRAVSTSIVFLGGLSLVLGVLGYWLAPQVLTWLNATEDIFHDALWYMRILMIGIVFPVFYNVYAAYLRALGDSKTPLYFLIVATVINIILSLLFVAGFGWGVPGVAVATIIAQGISAILCFFYTKRAVPLLRVDKLEFDREHFKLILKYGVPAAIQLSFVTLSQLLITGLINGLGTTSIAGMVAASKVDHLAIVPLSTMSLALSTFVGQNIGAGQEARARKGLRSGFLMMLGLGVGISVLLNLFSASILSLFLDLSDPAAQEIQYIGSSYLSILVSFYFLFAALFSFNGFLRGAGDAKAAMVMPIISLGIRTAAAYIMVLVFGMGVNALAWSIPMGWAISSTASFLYYLSNRWQGKGATQLLQEKPEADPPKLRVSVAK